MTITRNSDYVDDFGDHIAKKGIAEFTRFDFQEWLEANHSQYYWTAADASNLLQQHRLTSTTRYVLKCTNIGRGARWSIADAKDTKGIMERNCQENAKRIITEMRCRAQKTAVKDPKVVKQLAALEKMLASNLLGLQEAVSLILA